MKDQIVFKFPEKSFYYEEDFCVGENNYEAYKLIKEWPNWSFKGINIYGPKKSGKSYLTKIFSDKTNSKIFDGRNVNKDHLDLILNQKVLIIDNVELFNDEVFFQTILNDFISKNKFIYLTSNKLAGSISFKLKDLISRLNSLVAVAITNPSDDLFYQILTKMLSDKQINITAKEVNFILKNIERSYDAASKFVQNLDELSLLYKKKINTKIINKALTDIN
ncbi:DnaA ATPase involved in DNA replication initiation [Candidatus Pelagibacterales bacterium]|jgi:chromosomal replication initiation ATPase DnaA